MNEPSSVEEVRSLVLPFLQQHGFSTQAELSVLRGGANNRVYRVAEGSKQAVLKRYFQNPNDPRDRFRAEQAFYSFLWSRGVRRTPEPLGWDREKRLGLLSFVEGHKLQPEQVNDKAVGQALEFILALNQDRSAPDAADIPTASEACFSIAEHLACVERRVVRLRNIEGDGEVDDHARAFVERDLGPLWNQVRARILAACAERAAVALPKQQRCLSPSDFGFHNALLQPDGTLRFFDFEYAGWDDPAKLVCDFFCQPEIPVERNYWSVFTQALRDAFARRKEAHFKAIAQHQESEVSLQDRADLLLPAYQIKWCCIMLNDFVRTEQTRRQFSLGDEAMKDRKRIQLQKARCALAGLAASPK